MQWRLRAWTKLCMWLYSRLFVPATCDLRPERDMCTASAPSPKPQRQVLHLRAVFLCPMSLVRFESHPGAPRVIQKQRVLLACLAPRLDLLRCHLAASSTDARDDEQASNRVRLL